MARMNFLTSLILIIFIKSSTSFNLNCRYESTNGYAVIGRVYICVSSGINMLTPEAAHITSVSGTHVGQKSDKLVDGFHANRQVMNYFPQGLDRFFPNLNSIAIWRCGMKEIHQSDLKPFPGLRSLNMYDNRLQVLEQGLLDYNPNLEVVAFHGNRLAHIDPNVFDRCPKMTDLYMEGVPCIDKNAENRQDTLNTMRIMKTQCVNQEFMEKDKQVRDLINDSEVLSPEELHAKADQTENELSNYEFANFRPLSDSIEDLRNLRMNIPNHELADEVPEVPMVPYEDPSSVTEPAVSNTEGTTSTTEPTTSSTESTASSTESTTSWTESTITSTTEPLTESTSSIKEIESTSTISSTTSTEAVSTSIETTSSTTTTENPKSTESTTTEVTTTSNPSSSTETTTTQSESTTKPTTTTESATTLSELTTEATTSSTAEATSSSTTPEPKDPKNNQDPALDMKFEKLSQDINDLVTDTLTNVNNIKMIQDAADQSIKELKEAQDATKAHVESIDEKIKAIEAQVDEKFAALDKKLDNILKALRIGD